MSSKVTSDIQTIDKVTAALQGKRGRDIQSLRNKSNELKEQLQKLSASIGRRGRGFGGGTNDASSGTPLQTRVANLSRFVSGSYDMPGRTQDMLMRQAKEQLVEVKDAFDIWYAENWDDYLELVKGVDFSPIGSND
jgi:hypothetical protein